jgi:hypothetical protein
VLPAAMVVKVILFRLKKIGKSLCVASEYLKKFRKD